MVSSDHISGPGPWNRRGTMWNYVELCGTIFFAGRIFYPGIPDQFWDPAHVRRRRRKSESISSRIHDKR